jgi:glycosyltransferase involved in cell wall biosynthesis
MAAGVPVVASDLPSIREMTAGAAALVPPADPTALAAALSSLLGDEARRASLVAIGRARAATYSWDSAASAVVDAYERIRASGRR